MAAEPGIWENLLSMGVGGLSSGLFEMGGDLISNLFNKEGTSEQRSGTTQGLAQTEYAKQLMPLMPQITEKSMYSAAGLTGKTAGDVARQKIEGLTPSAGAMAAASGLRGEANKATAQAMQQANIGNALAARQESAMRRAVTDTGAGSPAAKMALLGKAGEISGENRMKALAGATDAMSKAGALKASNLAASQDILQKDIKTGFDTKVAPYLTQVNAGLGNQLFAGQAVDSAARANEGLAVSNPLGSLSQILGMGATGQMAGNIINTQLVDQLGLQKAMGGLNKEQLSVITDFVAKYLNPNEPK